MITITIESDDFKTTMTGQPVDAFAAAAKILVVADDFGVTEQEPMSIDDLVRRLSKDTTCELLETVSRAIDLYEREIEHGNNDRSIYEDGEVAGFFAWLHQNRLTGQNSDEDVTLTLQGIARRINARIDRDITACCKNVQKHMESKEIQP